MKKKHLFLFFISIFIAISPLHAKKVSSEYRIKASYLFNFIRFITWPTGSSHKTSKSIQVCAFNSNHQLNKAFKPVIGKKIKGQPLRFKKITNFSNVSQCHLLYIEKSKQRDIDDLLPLIKKHHILFISDARNFCKNGGMIGMVKKKGKIRLEINLKVTKLAGFNISSNLLEVAKIIRK